MLKLFLVEDEIIVREGIKNNINWQENGYLFCGEASDGELAFPMIQKLKPDIVITDIRMPFLDGLQLSRLIRLEMPWIKIIILSGYGEFEYAKQAIDIGVTKYLLKPMSGMELLNCLKVVGEDIYNEQREKANLEMFKRDMKEYELEERRRLFHDMVSNEQPLAQILIRGNELNLELSAMAYNIILLTMKYEPMKHEYGKNEPTKLEPTKHESAKNESTKLESAKNGSVKHESSKYEPPINEHLKHRQKESILLDNPITKARYELEELFDGQEDIIMFDFMMEGMALLIKGGTIEELRHKQLKYIKLIEDIMASYSLSYFGGIGLPVTRLGELSHSYHEASRAFAYRYISNASEIIDSNILKKDNVSLVNDTFETTDIVQLDKRKVEEFLKSGRKEEIDYFVDEYLKSIRSEAKHSLLFCHYIVMDITYIASGIMNDLGYEYDFVNTTIQNKEEFQQLLSSFESVKNYIKTILGEVMDFRDEIMAKDEKLLINKAKTYISANYCNEEISLNQVAASVYISPNHFSAIFRKKTGETFIKYLTDLRMNKAKELLRCTDMRTSEVGIAVGYKDPQYFSFLFKKTQKCTPKQYRYDKY